MGIFSIFQEPWLLLGLLSLPALWWLMRYRPPTAQKLAFPAVWLVARLKNVEETPRHTPWWLLLLRLIILALVIGGLARPVLDSGTEPAGQGPVVLIIDNDWAAAPDWEKRTRTANRLIDGASAGGQGIAVLATAVPAGRKSPPLDPAFAPAATARDRLAEMAPVSWPVNRDAFLSALDSVDWPDNAQIVWLWNGIGGPAVEKLAARLADMGRLTVVTPAEGTVPPVISGLSATGDGLSVTVARQSGATSDTLSLRGQDRDGATITREPVTLPAGQSEATVPLRLPVAARNRLSRLEIAGVPSAAATYLFGDEWRQRRLGLLSPAADDTAPLTSPRYYLRRALAFTGSVTEGPFDKVAGAADVLILTDRALGPGPVKDLGAWVDSGGVLVRFAGNAFAARPDPLTPVPVRPGSRQMGSLLTWEDPVPLAPFDADSPFAGLDVPEDVTVARQVLAEPVTSGDAAVWARLADGTPLVTAERRGQGWLILFHIGAEPGYSSLVYSGLFVEMLDRITRMAGTGSRATAGKDGTLSPREILTGRGTLTAAPPGLESVSLGNWNTLSPSALTPPGVYEGAGSAWTLNLAGRNAVAEFGDSPDWPAGIRQIDYAGERTSNLMPWMLLAAIILATVDLGLLALRGLFPRRLAGGAAALVLALGLPVGDPASAQQTGNAADNFAAMAAGQTHLAYVETGDPARDRLTKDGLDALSSVLTRRTSVEPGAPMAVDLTEDAIIFFPVLYWRVAPPYPTLSPAEIDKLRHYLETGGILVVDTGDGNTLDLGPREWTRQPAPEELAGWLNRFAPAPLARMNQDHVLTKAFYLLRDLPGRWADNTVWVTADSNDGEAVSPIVVTSQGWAAAWAISPDGQPMVPIIPGGARQQELAWRAGVNLVMYALTGTYKEDQVHVPALLERLGQ